MSSIDRPLRGEALVFDLAQERATTAGGGQVERSGRNARTLIKDGELRVTLIVVGAGGEIPEHQADGPITVHVLDGAIEFVTAKGAHPLGAGHLLALPGGVRHSVRSADGGTFLLTVCRPER